MALVRILRNLERGGNQNSQESTHRDKEAGGEENRQKKVFNSCVIP